MKKTVYIIAALFILTEFVILFPTLSKIYANVVEEYIITSKGTYNGASQTIIVNRSANPGLQSVFGYALYDNGNDPTKFDWTTGTFTPSSSVPFQLYKPGGSAF